MKQIVKNLDSYVYNQKQLYSFNEETELVEVSDIIRKIAVKAIFLCLGIKGEKYEYYRYA